LGASAGLCLGRVAGSLGRLSLWLRLPVAVVHRRAEYRLSKTVRAPCCKGRDLSVPIVKVMCTHL